MSVQRVQFTGFDHSFEERAFHTLANRLETLSGDYTIGGPFFAGRRQIDGLIISPTCVFTLEYKAIQGRIERGLNTPTRAYDGHGRAIDLSSRHEDPFVQAANQWKPVRDLFRDAFGVEDIYVKSALVFDSGSVFSVPADNRDFSNPYVPAFILNLDEVVDLVQTFQPPRCRYLDESAQAALVAAIRAGPARVTSAHKRAVTGSRIIAPVAADTAVPPRRPLAGTARMRPASFPQAGVTHASSREAPSQPSAPPAPETAVAGLSWRRILPQVVVLALAYGLFSLWGQPLVAALLTLLLYGVTQMGSRWRTGYTFVGGMVFTIAQAVWSLGLVAAVATAVFWPVGAPLAYFSDDVAPLVEEAFEEMREAVEEGAPLPEDDGPALDGEEAPRATTETAAGRVEVIGNSNVRAGPGTEFDVVKVVLAGETYPVLAENEAGTWFQIRLNEEQTGWIGSSRVRELAP